MKNAMNHSGHGEHGETASVFPMKDGPQETALLVFFAVPAVPQGYFLRGMSPCLKGRY
jgi:hypothetical protein